MGKHSNFCGEGTVPFEATAAHALGRLLSHPAREELLRLRQPRPLPESEDPPGCWGFQVKGGPGGKAAEV